jgi:uncharacterized protein YprB with RNaseH-like and TPR domain
MTLPSSHWKELYEKFKHQALCVDVEATYWNGPISIVGVYKPKEGEIEYTAFVMGKNLTTANLKQAFEGCRLLITFNGTNYDVPEIKKQFPGVIPENIPVVDLYLLARRLDLNAGLKTLEQNFKIFRRKSVDSKKKISTKMWRKYEQTGDEKFLNILIEYNREDTINLYPLAEKIMKMVK